MEREILEAVQRTLNEFTRKGPPWNALKGDVCCRVIMHFLRTWTPGGYEAVGPNAWIMGFPTEFDVLLTKPEARPYAFSAVYQPKDIFACLEVKEQGLYGTRQDLTRIVNKKRMQFDDVRRLHPHIECGYLTLREVGHPARTSSINFLEITKKGLNPYPVFCLQESRTGAVRRGEWARLLAWLDSCVRKVEE